MEIKKGGFYLRTRFSTTLFTTGKIYKSPKDGYLIDNKGNLYHCNIDAFTDKIAVHTPTQEDWDYVISKVREEYYNNLATYGKDTCILLIDGRFCPKKWCETVNCHIITIEQFRDLFKEKVYILGHKTRIAEVLAKLESLGGVNNCMLGCTLIGKYYFLDNEGNITYSTHPPKGYTEIFLDEPKITKEQVELKVVEYAKSFNWDFDKVCKFVNQSSNIPHSELGILNGAGNKDKVQYIFAKYKPKEESEPNITELGRISDVVGGFVTKSDKSDKPEHYATGIDTFARMEANCSVEECIAFAKGNIDKYNWRKKGQDIEDFDKIIAYANWAKKLLSKSI